jgi:hypothetical protein
LQSLFNIDKDKILEKLFLLEKLRETDYEARTPEHYINAIAPEVLASLDETQLASVKSALAAAIPQPSLKLVDFRFVVDLIFSRFYIVILVGKDRRKRNRKYIPEHFSKVGNIIAAIVLLLTMNVFISVVLFLFAYLLKSAVGIDLFPGHTGDNLQNF